MKKKFLKFLITAGPTRENLDPVRYLTNRSSGKMGYALAAAAKKVGGDVVLVSGPVSLEAPAGVKVIPVVTAREMHKAVMARFKPADVIIKVAAVSDYRPSVVSVKKIKKDKETLTLKLVKNPDILKELGKKKKPAQILVGFAAETNDIFKYGFKKLVEKKCDYMVVNKVGKNLGFEKDSNHVFIFSKDGKKVEIKGSKKNVAKKIIELICK